MASSSSARQYEVFLSFRGEDTRKGFVSHLYRELQTKGIITFKDDRKLQTGDSLSNELPKAIQESKFAVVVISQNYASSRWCLDELQMIMERHKQGILKVVPIFYEVDPSDVRNQRSAFAEAFGKHQIKEEPEEKIQKWREALTDVANLTGKDSRNCQDEATMVRDIVGEISNQLLSMLPEDTSDIFGMDAHFEGLDPLLNMGSEDNQPRMVGIWGMGGIGKTTIAKCLYSKYKWRFPYHCFIENIKKYYNEHGQRKLQQLFLSKIFCDENFMPGTCVVDSNTVKARLSGLKVLAIFDDVDELSQLQALAKEADWFGPGSRIIITTRDKGLQISSDMGLYEAKCLGEEVAVKLFNHFAFGEGFNKDQVPNDFADLSIRASRLVRGLPLALKVLGSFLRGRKIDEWEAAISRLIGSPRKTIMECLKVSYHGLDEPNKGIFLTVACLVSKVLHGRQGESTCAFNGQPVNRLVQLLEGKEREIRRSLKMLAEKALIDISNDGCVTIHDLIKEMAEEIVHEQSPDDPGRRKFLWDDKEIYDVLEDGTGTDAIEGISLNFFNMPAFPTRAGAFKSMRNLKFIRISTTHGCKMEDILKIRVVFNHLPRKLKLLDWFDCPLTALPSSFKGECLVELYLNCSTLTILSDGTLDLRNLRKMDLSMGSYLEETPSLCGSTKLEELCLPRSGVGRKRFSFDMEQSSWECESQNGFLRSIMGLKSLKVLSLEDWVGLSELPKSIQNFSVLRKLELTRSWNLKDIPHTIGELTSLKTLRIRECEHVKSIPDTIGRLIALETLDLGCGWSLSEIPNCIGNLTALRNLDLSACGNLKNIPNTIGYLTSLKHLNLSYCKQLTTIPDTIGNLTALQTLNLISCTMLLGIPSTIGKLTALEVLLLGWCEKLENIPSTIGNLTPLQVLSFSNCKMLLEIPSTIGKLTALKKLDLTGCERLESIPDTIGDLTTLETLKLSGCNRLSEFPCTMSSLDDVYPPENISCMLKILDGLSYGGFGFYLIMGAGTEGYLERALGTQALEVVFIQREHYCHDSIPFQCKSLSISRHLRKLTLRNLNIWDIPNDLGDLQVLQSLDLSGNDFEILPASIKQLSLLEQLILSFCRNIRSLPELPPKLKHLYTSDCFSLESISNVFSHPFEELMLYRCFNLGKDRQLFIQNMIDSMPMHKGKVKMWACFSALDLLAPFPARKVRNCFSHQSTKQKLRVPCARTDSGFKPVGFVAGVVVSWRQHRYLTNLNVHCHWHGEGYPSRNMHFKQENLPTHASSLIYYGDLIFVFSCNFGEEKSCDGISFHFDANWKDTDGIDHNCIIEGCGVQLCFPKELHQEQRQDTGKWEEYEKSSDLGRVHQPGHNEKLNNEETQPPNSKRRNFCHFL